jgi:predicted dehydrogenase
MKRNIRIGVLDHHLANYHADTFFTLIAESDVARVAIAYEIEPRGPEDWCAKRGVRRAASIDEVVAESDALMVLAPDNFEVHTQLALPALASGKPVFVDKFLAPTVAEAREIVAAARRSGAPLMSSSALRFASEVEALVESLEGEIETFFARGMGHWSGYGVHTVAMVMRALRDRRARRVADVGREGADVVAVDFDDGLRGSIEVRQAENQFSALPWQLGLRVAGNYHVATVSDYDVFYRRLIAAVLDFFRSGQSPTSVEEMLDTVGILQAAQESRAADGRWCAVGGVGVL